MNLPNSQGIRMSGSCVASDVFNRTDLLEEILVRMPPQFISNSILVSKSWFGFTRRSSFLDHYTRIWSHEVNQLQHRLHSQQLAAVDGLFHQLQFKRLAYLKWFSQKSDALDLNDRSQYDQLCALGEKLDSQQLALVNELKHQLQSEQLAEVNELQPQCRQLATMNELQQLAAANQSQQLAAVDPSQHLIAVQHQLRAQLLVAVDQLQDQFQSQLLDVDKRLKEQLLRQIWPLFFTGQATTNPPATAES